MGTYAVMLPLRLETRFIPPGMSAELPEEPDPDQSEWRLRLRVMPDRASITTERLEPTPPELVALQSLWDTLSKDPLFPDPLPADPDLRLDAVVALAGWTDAFARLAAVTGPARARQLVGTVPAVGIPPRVPVAAAGENWVIPTVRGLPAALDVWVIWAGADPDAPAPQPEVIATLSPNKDLLSLSPLPESDDDSPEQRWWGSWASAVTAGLAEEIVLARDPEEIEVLGVSGLGPGDGTTAAALFTAHGLSGDLGILRPGAPTSTVFGSPTVDVVDMDVWAGLRSPGRHPVLDVLTGQGGAADVPVDPLLGVHEDWTQRIVSACYPALWGYGLQGVLGVLRDPRDPVHRPENAEWNLDLWGWATRVAPSRGPLPTRSHRPAGVRRPRPRRAVGRGRRRAGACGRPVGGAPHRNPARRTARPDRATMGDGRRTGPRRRPAGTRPSLFAARTRAGAAASSTPHPRRHRRHPAAGGRPRCPRARVVRSRLDRANPGPGGSRLASARTPVSDVRPIAAAQAADPRAWTRRWSRAARSRRARRAPGTGDRRGRTHRGTGVPGPPASGAGTREPSPDALPAVGRGVLPAAVERRSYRRRRRGRPDPAARSARTTRRAVLRDAGIAAGRPTRGGG